MSKKHGLFGVLVPPNQLVGGPYLTQDEAEGEKARLEEHDSRTDSTPVHYQLVVLDVIE
jgi:hypothetical protein